MAECIINWLTVLMVDKTDALRITEDHPTAFSGQVVTLDDTIVILLGTTDILSSTAVALG